MKTSNHLFKIGILLILLLSACTFTTSRLNREEDKKDAEKTIAKFFDLIKSKNYDAMYDLFSSKFWAVTSVKKMNEIFTGTENRLGALESTKLEDWQTKVVSGTDPSSGYHLVYKNHHKKYDSTETFNLMKDDDGKIRIVYYNIESDGFFK